MENMLKELMLIAARLPAQPCQRVRPEELTAEDHEVIGAAFIVFEKWAAERELGSTDRPHMALWMIQAVHESSTRYSFDQVRDALRHRRAAA